MKLDTILDTLISEARKSTMAHMHGAVLIRNGKVITKGYNSWNSNYAVHAEQSVLLRKDR